MRFAFLGMGREDRTKTVSDFSIPCVLELNLRNATGQRVRLPRRDEDVRREILWICNTPPATQPVIKQIQNSTPRTKIRPRIDKAKHPQVAVCESLQFPEVFDKLDVIVPEIEIQIPRRPCCLANAKCLEFHKIRMTADPYAEIDLTSA